MGRVAAKACVLTGAGSGIGKAIAARLALEGGKVVCVDLNGAAVAETVAEIQAAGGIAAAITADVSDSVAVDGFIQRCVELYDRVDILVNNAGVNLPGIFHEVSNADIDRTLNVNVKGYMYGSRAAIPHMLRQKSGSIVNISSVNGLVAEPFLALYAASKGARHAHQGNCPRLCQAGHPLQLYLSWLGGYAD